MGNPEGRWPARTALVASAVLVLAGCGGPPGAAETDSGGTDAAGDAFVATSEGTPEPGTTSPGHGSGRGTGALALRVKDGDTISVEYGSVVESVRLIGINAPESGECFSREATAALMDLVEGREVSLVRDVSDRDQFGRLLRTVMVEGEDVGARLVREGYAIAREYPPDTALAEVYAAAQSAAQAAGAGLWGTAGCTSNRDDVDLSLYVEADAPGDDNANLNGEWLEIHNQGKEPLDLAGWTVKDESASHRYTFPPGVTIPGGGVLVLFTGCGEDTFGERYWCNSYSAVWNNGGDTAFLLGPDGRTVATYGY